MRLCAIARALMVISIALMVGDACEVGVRGPYWPIGRRVVAEFGFLIRSFIAPYSAVYAAHCPAPELIETETGHFHPATGPLKYSAVGAWSARLRGRGGGTTSEMIR